MHRAEDKVIYFNLDYLRKKNRLTIKEMASVLNVPFNSLEYWMKRKTRIYERYGDQFAEALMFEKDYLFNIPFTEDDKDMAHIYVRRKEYRKIQADYRQNGVGDEAARRQALSSILSLFKRSFINVYVGGDGLVKYDRERVYACEPNERKDFHSGSLIRIDSSVSDRYSDASHASYIAEHDAWEEEISLIDELIERINSTFPSTKRSNYLMVVFVRHFIDGKSYKTIHDEKDFIGKPNKFSECLLKIESLAYEAFSLYDLNGFKELDHLRIYDKETGEEITDIRTKIKLYSLHKEEEYAKNIQCI